MNGLTPERWKQVEEIFNAALDRPIDERDAFLNEACGGEPSLREQIVYLINCHEDAGTFIEEPAAAFHATWMPPPDNDQQLGSMAGRQIGVYRLVREIGSGGMGAVYLAFRSDNQFRQRVAIKLIKRGMDTDFIIRRFRNERQILASFDHPNIARLLDGGATEDGLPYFVLEYIEGLPINRYCDEHRLSVRERLKLFRQVCAAAHYAHQRQVIHRDIKPGNILVTADGAPKLLDFGIAKILDPELASDTLHPTLPSVLLMTPDYASPEQARGEQVSPASDVYSLGVLLYELLAGRRPHRLRSRLPHEIARIICEEEPIKPSAAVAREDGDSVSAETISRNRGVTPTELMRELMGDLDNLTLKALRKDPPLRYASAEEFSVEVQRYLDGQPISASSPAGSAKDIYASGSFPGVKTLAVLPFKLLGATAKQPATEGADDLYLGVGLADALITRLGNLRSVAVRPTSSALKFAATSDDPVVVGNLLGVQYVLDGHIQRAGERVRVTAQLISVRDGAPLWAAQFDEKYTDLLNLQDSISIRVAESLAPQLTGEERAQIAARSSSDPQAQEAYLRGRYHWHTYTEEGLAKAITCFYEAIAIDPDYAQAYSGVADYFNWIGAWGVMPPAECFAAAKSAARKAIELDPALAEAYASLAFAVWAYDWNIAESERLFKHAIELNPNYAQAHEWYSHLCGSQGRHDEAIREMRRAERLNPRSASAAAMSGYCLHKARRYEEALAQFERALELEPDYHVALQGLGWTLPPLGRIEEAVAACRRSVEVRGRASVALCTLAHTLAIAGEREEARRIARELEELSQSRYVPPYYLAMIYTGLGEFDAAFAWLDRAIEARDCWAQLLKVEPRFDPLREDARFDQRLERIQPLPSEEAPTLLLARSTAESDLPDRPTVADDPATSATENRQTVQVGRPLFRVATMAGVALLAGIIAFAILKRSSGGGDNGAPPTMGYPVRLTNHTSDDRYPSVSPDGKKIAFSSNRDGLSEIYVMNVGGAGEPQRLTFNQVNDFGPVWSPDGRKLAFVRAPASVAEGDIYVMDADGSNQTNLTNSPWIDGDPCWSPDGGRIAFASNQASGSHSMDIFVMNAGGSNVTRLTSDPATEGGPAWSPDGSRMLFNRLTADQTLDVFVMNADGGQQTNLTNHPATDDATGFSPDGKLIAFASNRATGRLGKKNIFVMNADGGNVRRVTANPAGDYYPSWFPDSRRLAFFSERDGNSEIYLTDSENNSEINPAANAPGRKTIAVVYTREDGASPMDATLGSGLVDALTSKLGQIKQLAVFSTGAVRRYEGKPFDARRVGSELNVNYVLRGALRQADNKVQVSAELINASDGKIVWAEKFDERLTDISALQNSIAERVLKTLTLQLTSAELRQLNKRYTEDSEAYQLYLVGRYHFGKRSVADLNEAIKSFDRALERDSRFALAYAGLADSYTLLNIYGSPPPPDAYLKAREYAAKAIAVDDTVAEAHASLAYVKFFSQRERAEAESGFRRAIELNPSYATAHHWFAIALSAMGRHDEALAQIRLAEALDPRSAIIKSAEGMLLYYARRYDEALKQTRRALELDPGLVPAHRVSRWIHQAAGRYDEAMAAYQLDKRFSGDADSEWPVIVAQNQAVGGRLDEARASIERGVNSTVVKRNPGFLASEIAVAYTLIGDRKQAFSWLARAEAARTQGFNFVLVDPRLDGIRSDPRFAGIVRKAGWTN